MSRSAGTLITTNNATYIPPRFQPGYNGHVPTMKFDYGETYGNATAKYFQDYRSQSLSNSNSNYCKGGYFPTYYTHQPDLVIGNRTRSRDRWLSAPRYSLTTVDYDRQQELIRFDSSAQSHREHYKDKSGTSQRVDYFMLPNKAEDQLKKHLPLECHTSHDTHGPVNAVHRCYQHPRHGACSPSQTHCATEANQIIPARQGDA